ncbi:zinc-dependent peptidase [Fuerstiella marisgermanici]|uniref:Mlc titration factor A n=1 Tax=Fuerstiella marisgermanici TaxID=1891926 RepID=A0A1P8WLS5_9PLAN|nr:M90 family metallopeptidase [Fuerstiella marisgermanici]APZ95012.1 Mlc titration factor A [Fuerstiella marisgermanici]
MVFSWLRRRRRKKITSQEFPADWNRIIAANVAHDARLSDAQQRHLRNFVQIFVAETNWEGCHGLKITDEVKVTVAAQAALLTFNHPNNFFDHVLSVLVYPDEFIGKDVDVDSDGVVTERQRRTLGEAMWRGPVVLSWIDVLEGGRREAEGHNLVLHEFAHQLDMMNGRYVDGIPPLQTREQLQRWLAVMQPEYETLVANCRKRHWGVIDCYGAQNEAEFFSVLVEAFFERSGELRAQHPAAYDLLAGYFAIDPALWNSGAA